ncbi:MAG: hypothetical protein ACRD0K_17845 [Egibacteraceae bacterium]
MTDTAVIREAITPEEEAKMLAETVERIKASHAAVIFWVNDDNTGGYELIGCPNHAAVMLLQKAQQVFKVVAGEAMRQAVVAAAKEAGEPLPDPMKLN